jgi:hypothetical protein
MFPDRIEAWCDGPVVADIWPLVQGRGYGSLLPEESEPPPYLSAGEQSFIRSIWDRYKVYSATQPSTMTHNQGLWQAARGTLPAREESSNVISHESMRGYYGRLLAARVPSGTTQAQLVQADEDIDQGRFRTHQELKTRLRGKDNGL